MEKKIYVKPEAEHVIFYSEEELTKMNVLSDDDDIGILPSPDFSTPEPGEGWM